MKNKNAFLLLIFLCSFFPYKTAHAESELKRTPSDALAFLYLSDAVLANEVIDDGTSSVPGFSAPMYPQPPQDVRTDLINQMINAAKAQRNDHYHKCNDTVNLYRERGEVCEAEVTKEYCEEKYQQLTDKIASLRIVRGGDLRNPLTRAWHGIKRTGAKIWHRIGPIGRKFLREVGPEALKMVVTGGAGSEAIFKNVLKHTAKKIGREQMKKIALNTIQRLLKVRFDMATAAGIDICAEEELDDQVQSEEEDVSEEEEEEEELGYYQVQDTFDEASAFMEWEGFLPHCMHHQAAGTGAFIQLEIDLDEEIFNGTIAGANEAHSQEFGWEGWGIYSLDGITGSVTENTNGRGYILDGTGNIDITYRMEAWCLPEGSTEQVFTKDQKPLHGTATIKGNFYEHYGMWFLTIHVFFDNGTANFHLGCADCELFSSD